MNRAARLVLPLFVLAAVGCKDDAEPVLVDLDPVSTIADWTLTVTASADAVAAGTPVTFTATLLDADGVDVSLDYEFRTEISPSVGVIADGEGVYRFTKVDTYSYFASVDVQGVTLVDAAPVAVSAGPAADLRVDVDLPVVDAGMPVTAIATVTDAWGNATTGDVTYSVDPSATVSGDQITATASGAYVVTGQLVDSTATDTDNFTVQAGDPISLDISLNSYDVERGQGVVVTTLLLDQYGNEVDFPVTLSTDPGNAEPWANFVRFEEEGIFMVMGDVPEFGLHDEDGPVLVDSSGPGIRVTTPQRGAEIPSAAGPTVQVSGSVTDPWSGVASVTINGDPASLLPGGLFDFQMTPEQGLNGIDIVATDVDGNVSDHYQTFLWGEFLPVGDYNEDGLIARMNEEAIEVLEDFVATGLDTSSLFSGLTANLWTSPQWCIGVSWLAEVCGQVLVDVTQVDMAGLTFDMDPNDPNGQFPNGYLDFAATIDDLLVTVTVTGVFSGSVLGGLYTWSESLGIDLDITSDYINVDTNVGLEVNASNDIVVSLANTTIDAAPIQFDFPDLGIFGDILTFLPNFLVSTFQPLINGLLGPIIDSQLPGLIEDALADLEIATVMDLLGTPLEIGALPGFITIDDDGMTLALDSYATTPAVAGAPPTIGSWRREDYEIPTYGATPAFSISFADNFVNQLLHAVWQAGVMDFELDSASLGLDLTDFEQFLPISTIEFNTLPLLPPVVGPSASSGGLLELGLGDMLVEVWGDPGGTYGLMMQLAVTLTADAELEIDANNEIQFGLGTPSVVMEFVTSEFPDLNGEVAENLMDSVVDLIIPQITGALDGIGGIPIPELAGFGLDAPGVEREVAPVYYITAEGGLSFAP